MYVYIYIYILRMYIYIYTISILYIFYGSPVPTGPGLPAAPAVALFQASPLRPRGAQALRRAVGGAGEGESKQTVEQEIQAEGREKNDLGEILKEIIWINNDEYGLIWINMDV